MDAKLYVYAYLLLSAVYAAACIQYVTSVGRTASLTRRLQRPPGDLGGPSATADNIIADVRTALQAISGADSAAFACAILPLAYVAVTGVLASLLSGNPAAASTINPLWMLATIALIAGHVFFLTRIVGTNTKLNDASAAALTPAFVARETRRLLYFRGFLLAVTVFNVANTVYLLANLPSVVALPYIM